MIGIYQAKKISVKLYISLYHKSLNRLTEEIFFYFHTVLMQLILSMSKCRNMGSLLLGNSNYIKILYFQGSMIIY